MSAKAVTLTVKGASKENDSFARHPFYDSVKTTEMFNMSFSLQQQFLLGNYSFQIKALDPLTNTVQEGYRFDKPIKVDMFYDVANLVRANEKYVNKELTEEDVEPVLYLWDPDNHTW